MKTIAAVLMMCLGMVCMADNLLVNGDMKNDKGWMSWGRGPKDPAVRAQLLTYVNEGPNGERVLKFNEIAEDSNPYLVQHVQVAGVTPAQKYKLEFKAKVPAGQNFCVDIQMLGGKKFLGGIRGKVFGGTGDWKEYECTFTGVNPESTMLTVVFFPFWPRKSSADTGCILLAEADFELAD